MTEQEFQESTIRQRNKLLIDNPLIVSYFFKERSDEFIHKILFKHLQVKDFWFRIEFQHRGSPHIHGFLWLVNAPSIENLMQKTDEQIIEVINYFDKLVCACNNNYASVDDRSFNPCKIHYTQVRNNSMYSSINEGENETQSLISKYLADYHTIINKLQRHTKCTSSCLRKKRNTNVMVCRYKFPRELTNESKFIVNEKGFVELQLKRNDSRMNNHMPFISVHYRANIDVSPVVSTDAVIKYIAKYASKHETSSNAMITLRDHLNLLTTDNRTAISLIQSILIRQCAMRDYSSSETMWIVAGFPFYHSSRKFLVLILSSDAFLPVEDEVNQEQVNNKNPEEAYANRLQNFRLIALNRPVDNQNEQEQRIENEINLVRNMSFYKFFGIYYKTSVNAEFWRKFRKRPVLRIFPRLNKTDMHGNLNQDYFKFELKIHVPWQDDFENQINPENRLWSDIYQQHSSIIPGFLSLDNQLEDEDEFEEEDEQNVNNIDLHEWMIYARDRPNSLQLAAELGLREQDHHVNWTESYQNYENHLELANFVQNLTNNPQQIEDISMPEVEFSEDQIKVLDVIDSQIEYLNNGHQRENFRRSIIIQGKAGSDKSTLIQAIKSKVCTNFNNKSIVIMAPTGAASSNINCQTIHSKLKISISRQLNILNQTKLSELQDELRECKFIIIDEMSLVGCSLLSKIDIRCREGKGVNDLPFGGMFFILLGDLKQLPPVMDRALYGNGFNSELSNVG